MYLNKSKIHYIQIKTTPYSLLRDMQYDVIDQPILSYLDRALSGQRYFIRELQNGLTFSTMSLETFSFTVKGFSAE